MSQCTGGEENNGQMQASDWSGDVSGVPSLADHKWNFRQELLHQEMVRLDLIVAITIN